jgi:hypothetical protein
MTAKGVFFFRLTGASRRDSLSRLSNSTADKLSVVWRREKARRSPRQAIRGRGVANHMYFSTTEASMLLKTHNRVCETKLRFAPKAAQNTLENAQLRSNLRVECGDRLRAKGATWAPDRTEIWEGSVPRAPRRAAATDNMSGLARFSPPTFGA